MQVGENLILLGLLACSRRSHTPIRTGSRPVRTVVTRVGGLARSKGIGWDAYERHRLCVNHSYKTGINIAASLHLVAALPNSHYFEYCVEQGALRQTLA